MRWTTTVLTTLTLVACHQPAPPIEDPGSATTPAQEDRVAADAHLLPAGLYFRGHCLHNPVEDEPDWTTPTHAVVLGPYSTVDAVDAALATIPSAAMTVGYPLVVHTDELVSAEVIGEGIVLVMALTASRAFAVGWLTRHTIAGALIIPLLDRHEASRRNQQLGNGISGDLPRHVVVRIALEAPVRAFSGDTISAAESAYSSTDPPTPARDPLRSPPEVSLCTLAPGTIFVVASAALYTMSAYRWAPVRCGDQRAFVPWRRTLLNSVILRSDQGNRMLQIGDVNCDMACYCEWSVDDEGRREGVAEAADLESGCCCGPSCAEIPCH